MKRYLSVSILHNLQIIVTKPDGTPKEGELIELSAALGVRKFSRQFVTDSAGAIQYTICDGISENVSSISLEVCFGYTVKFCLEI